MASYRSPRSPICLHANFAGLRHECVGEQSLSEQAVAAEGRARPARPLRALDRALSHKRKQSGSAWLEGECVPNVLSVTYLITRFS